MVVATDGAGSHPNSRAWPPARLSSRRQEETLEAAVRLGLTPERVRFLHLPDTRAPTGGAAFDEAVDALAVLATGHHCDTVLATWQHDPHRDHEAAWLRADALAERLALRLLAYPVWGWLLPPDHELACAEPEGWRLDIAPFLATKNRAIQAHETQYGSLIDDDPDGFRLPSALLSVFEAPFEVFLRTC